jgi:predicted metal-dependent hydrolase
MISAVRLRPDTARALERGKALFNDGSWFEAHEAWEDAWREEGGEVRLLLQGLIQVAAGYLKAAQGRPSGAVKLLAAGLSKLSGLPEGLGGLSLARFCDGVARSLTEARLWEAGQGPGIAAPAPRLE